MIFQRLKKNYQRLRSYLQDVQATEAYRLYDLDIPEYPYIVEVFKNFAIIHEKGKRDVVSELRTRHLEELKQAVVLLLKIDVNNIIVKERQQQDNKEFQYSKISSSSKLNDRLIVKEGPGLAKFYINLHDYLDCGLFLDHRPLRRRIFKESTAKTRLLNLFSYTGSISVTSALKGATVVSVDWSNSYQNWAKDNFRLNQLDISKHQFIVSDIVLYLKSITNQTDKVNKFDIIVIDPPTFSNSKKRVTAFGTNWEVERDHFQLITLALPLLSANGRIYFSTNKRTFKLSPLFEDIKELIIKDISSETIPKDFRDQKVHQVFLITK